MISTSEFITVIENAPLVSVDLLVHNNKKQILVGKRVNNPAQGYWFVPGGRIRKNEPLQEAVIRLMKGELGVDHFSGSYTISGIYDHFYDTCFYPINPLITSTHYVSIGVNIELNEKDINIDVFLQQHSQHQWMFPNEIMNDEMVHPYTKDFMEYSTYGIITY